jgi:hypothetical protein
MIQVIYYLVTAVTCSKQTSRLVPVLYYEKSHKITGGPYSVICIRYKKNENKDKNKKK